MELSITEKLTYSTIRIECEYSDGSMGTGTGFFFTFKNDPIAKSHHPVLITNNHVVQGAKTCKLIFTTSDQNFDPLDRKHHTVNIINFESAWRKHPDPSVDLCAMPISTIIKDAEARGVNIYYVPLSFNLLPNKEQLLDLGALEEVIMVGYPNGIWDRVNNKPILRRGVTATHPNLDYNGKKEIMIDIAAFPGSSGSPVFIINLGSYTKKTGATIMGASRVIFLGVLFAGPQHTASGDLEIIDVPTIQKPIVISRIPNNLGLIIKSERILELEQLF